MSQNIEPGSPLYSSLYMKWKRQGGGQVIYGDVTYVGINDSSPENPDYVKFVPAGPPSTFDRMYGKSVMGPRDSALTEQVIEDAELSKIPFEQDNEEPGSYDPEVEVDESKEVKPPRKPRRKKELF